MHIIRIISIIRIILIIRIIFRFVKILDLQTTCGRTRGRWLPNPLITWAISFVLPCVPGGFPTSIVCTERRMVWPRWALLWEKAPWWSMIESTPLLDAASTVLPWWMTRMRLACNLQWIPTLKCDFWLWNNAYNWNNNCNNSDIIAIIVTVWAHSTAMAAPPMFHNLGFTHRIGVPRNAVHRTYLQGPQSCSAKTNNAYNRNNNAYNSTGTLHQAAFHSVCAPSSRCSWAGILLRH